MEAESHDRLKTLKITHIPHTFKSTYTADLVNFVELFYYDAQNHIVHSAFSPIAFQFGVLQEFDHELMLVKFDFKQGYYFSNHKDRTGNYAGDDFKAALDMLAERNYAFNVKPTTKNKKRGFGKSTTKKQKQSFSVADEDDGDSLEFDDDGECIGDDTWDYPGSPKLNDDDDIY